MFASLAHVQSLSRLLLAVFLASPLALQATTVNLQTSLGILSVELFDTAAPQTVANFLNYVNSGAYNNSFFHRSARGFVLQGGGYTWNPSADTWKAIPATPPVVNEFSSSRSNLRGTIAMAKLGGNPNSATSQWFINLADNSANLDTQNGGFTVFGQVSSGMTVVDALAALSTVNAGSPFDSLPVLSLPPSGVVTQQQLAMISTATVQPTATSVPVVEFYNTTLDHYFITANAAEASTIDSGGAGPGWIRTGNSFKSGGSAAVCRFYGSQSPGPNSHFYTVDANECASLKQMQASIPSTEKRWNFESLDFYSTPPSSGSCPAGTAPVFRAYNNGFTRGVDSNHRLTSSAVALQEVVARGWSNEGAVMCAPN
jgi:cyclophilin family peptidyl-prolyl cis-trans isomerase